MLTFCTTDSGPSFWNTFAEEAGKLGVRLEHSSAYKPGSQAAVKTGGMKSETLTQDMWFADTTANPQSVLLHEHLHSAR